MCYEILRLRRHLLHLSLACWTTLIPHIKIVKKNCKAFCTKKKTSFNSFSRHGYNTTCILLTGTRKSGKKSFWFFLIFYSLLSLSHNIVLLLLLIIDFKAFYFDYICVSCFYFVFLYIHSFQYIVHFNWKNKIKFSRVSTPYSYMCIQNKEHTERKPPCILKHFTMGNTIVKRMLDFVKMFYQIKSRMRFNNNFIVKSYI